MKHNSRKIMVLLSLILALTFVLGSCNQTEKKDGDLLKIGVLQLVEHQALDESYRGFIDGLAENKYIDGENITIDYNNAQGNQANANTIANKLVTQNSDLIFAIATPAVQAAKNATADSNIPVVFAAVTDAAAVGLIKSNDAPGGNITGASDMTPVKEQIMLLNALYPEAKKIGLLYSSAEVNSKIQIDIAIEAAQELGLEVEEFTFSNTNEVTQVVESAITKVDALYSPTDNDVATTVSNIVAITNEKGIPFIVGESALVEKGALATYGIDYYELGKLAGAQAAKILKGESPATIPVAYLDTFSLLVNEETAKKLNLELPENLEELFNK